MLYVCLGIYEKVGSVCSLHVFSTNQTSEYTLMLMSDMYVSYFLII